MDQLTLCLTRHCAQYLFTFPGNGLGKPTGKAMLNPRIQDGKFACLSVHVYYSVSASNRGSENLPDWRSVKPKIHN